MEFITPVTKALVAVEEKVQLHMSKCHTLKDRILNIESNLRSASLALHSPRQLISS